MSPTGIIEEGIRASLWIGRYFFEEVHEQVTDRVKAEDILYDIVNKFIQEFEEVIVEDRWTSAYEKYNISDGYDELIHVWGRKALHKHYHIIVE